VNVLIEKFIGGIVQQIGAQIGQKIYLKGEVLVKAGLAKAEADKIAQREKMVKVLVEKSTNGKTIESKDINLGVL
jgi:hypothetical protein